MTQRIAITRLDPATTGLPQFPIGFAEPRTLAEERASKQHNYQTSEATMPPHPGEIAPCPCPGTPRFEVDDVLSVHACRLAQTHVPPNFGICLAGQPSAASRLQGWNPQLFPPCLTIFTTSCSTRRCAASCARNSATAPRAAYARCVRSM